MGKFKGLTQSGGYVIYKHSAQTNLDKVHLLC